MAPRISGHPMRHLDSTVEVRTYSYFIKVIFWSHRSGVLSIWSATMKLHSRFLSIHCNCGARLKTGFPLLESHSSWGHVLPLPSHFLKTSISWQYFQNDAELKTHHQEIRILNDSIHNIKVACYDTVSLFAFFKYQTKSRTSTLHADHWPQTVNFSRQQK